MLTLMLTQVAHGKKIAVIENEFGEVGIDDALLKENTKLQAEEAERQNEAVKRMDATRLLRQRTEEKEALAAELEAQQQTREDLEVLLVEQYNAREDAEEGEDGAAELIEDLNPN